MTTDIEERKRLSFEQAEGVAPLPSQLQLREISAKLRALLWERIHKFLSDVERHNDYASNSFDKPWSTILRDEFVWRQDGMVDDFENDAKKLTKKVRAVFEKGDYIAVFGWLEFVLKHPASPPAFADHIERVLKYCRVAYRVVDKKVICPVASDAEHQTIEKRSLTSLPVSSTVRAPTSAMLQVI
ncbi:AbiJ-NTD4 domain-containing protein [Bradyrhizobium sp. Arg816]|uniref:AbiJ-NTD4 domain-containing protein n=1 Tax=Bradyrhizobium sp. Arg816 TaxID=2998491 RepID=UPI00249F6A4E|nr:hypothetical protein [Bradyrhizobium sp. Arg816]MDI3562542.1 hypothetical protein [Bradyrhizobium sp. Arg816]